VTLNREPPLDLHCDFCRISFAAKLCALNAGLWVRWSASRTNSISSDIGGASGRLWHRRDCCPVAPMAVFRSRQPHGRSRRVRSRPTRCGGLVR
jgi:hypothetical protein